MSNILLPSGTMVNRVFIAAIISGGMAAIVCLIVLSLLKAPKDEQKQYARAIVKMVWGFS